MTIARVTGAILFMALAACARADNTGESVQDALRQANIRDVTVEVGDDGRRIRLDGTVETLADRRRAEEIAAAIVGTSGLVENDVTVVGLDYPVNE